MTTFLGHSTGRKPGGYTFFELALAMAIIVVVFIATAPLIASSLQERRLRAAMESCEQLIRDARLQAEESGREMIVDVRPNGLAFQGGDDKTGIKGMLFSIRFGSDPWEKAQDQVWPIFSCGLVAPASLRIQEGEAWLEADFDCLTGGIAEERYSF